MYRVIYVSSETAPFTDARLDELLRKSRHANLAAKITGLLLYKDGHFLQILEGPKPAVLALLARIKDDPRHRALSVLLEADTPNREFKEWSMGFKKLDATTSREVPGYKEFDDLGLTLNQFAANPSKSLALLLAFKDAKL
jgi:hypothetical protein